MLEIEKKIKITVDGDDVETVKRICELASRYISASGAKAEDGVDEFCASEVQQIESAMRIVFDA